MIEVTKYQCEKCGAMFDTPFECDVCEAFHLDVAGQPKYLYDPKSIGPEGRYPHSVIITMDDGKEFIFKR